jgi:hypothetical protein
VPWGNQGRWRPGVLAQARTRRQSALAELFGGRCRRVGDRAPTALALARRNVADAGLAGQLRVAADLQVGHPYPPHQAEEVDRGRYFGRFNKFRNDRLGGPLVIDQGGFCCGSVLSAATGLRCVTPRNTREIFTKR